MWGRRSPVPVLASRFLTSRTSDRFLSLIAWVSIIGVALGVMALTVVTSVINGFESELVRVITGMNGDVVLYTRGEPITDAPKVEAKVRKLLPQVEAMTPSYVLTLMASGPNGVAGAILEGVDLPTLGSVTQVPSRVISGRMPKDTGISGPDGSPLLPEVAMGSALAERIGVREGGEVRLVVPFVEGSQEGDLGAPKVIKARLTGIVKMGLYEYDSKFVYSPISVVQKALDQPDKITSFKIKLAPGADARVASDVLAENFGYPFRSKDWGQLNKNLLYAIKLEKVVITIILTVIVIVAAFNVVSTLMMMIHDKTKEIAILKAMGLRPGQSFRLFCLIGMGIGTVGTILGVLAGLGLNSVLKTTRLIDLPADIYYIGYLPVWVEWKEVGLIVVLSLILSFVATLYPAYRVSTRPALEGLRYD